MDVNGGGSVASVIVATTGRGRQAITLAVLIAASAGCASSGRTSDAGASTDSASATTICISNAEAGLAQLEAIPPTQQPQTSEVLSSLAIEYGEVGGDTTPTFQAIYGGYQQWLRGQFGVGGVPTNEQLQAGIVQQCRSAAGSSSTTASTSTSPPPAGVPSTLHSAGGIAGISAALQQAAIDGTILGFDNPTFDCGPASAPLAISDYVTCRADSLGGPKADVFIRVTGNDATTISLVPPTWQVSCNRLNAGERRALEAFEGTQACVSPTGVAIPSSASAPSQEGALVDAVLAAPLTEEAYQEHVSPAAAVVYETADPHDSSWVMYLITPSGANTGSFPTVAGLATTTDGTWKVVSGPSLEPGCGIPRSVPSSVLTAFHIQRMSSCPAPATTRETAATPPSDESTTPATAGIPGPVVSFGGSLAQLSQAAQSSIRSGPTADADAVPDAVVTCGPADADFVTGAVVHCGAMSQSLGNFGVFVEIDSPTTFAFLLVGEDPPCSQLTAAEQAAYDAYPGEGTQSC